jgi:hypothetical protein
MTPLGQAAIALGTKGLRVFPCWPRRKEPAIRDNLRLAAVDPIIITRFWGEQGQYNVAIATGRGSGVWVLDVDADENGDRPSASLKPSTARCRRPSKSSPPTVGISTGAGWTASKSATSKSVMISPVWMCGAKADTSSRRPQSILPG